MKLQDFGGVNMDKGVVCIIFAPLAVHFNTRRKFCATVIAIGTEKADIIL